MIQTLARMNGVICVTGRGQIATPRSDRQRRPPRGSRLMGMEPLLYKGDPTKIYEFIDERSRASEARRGQPLRSAAETWLPSPILLIISTTS